MTKRKKNLFSTASRLAIIFAAISVLEMEVNAFPKKPVSELSSEALIECLSYRSIEDKSCSGPIGIHDELIIRKPIELLVQVVETTSDDFQRKHLLDVLYHIDDDRVSVFMQRQLNDSAEGDNYFYAMYLGKKGTRGHWRFLISITGSGQYLLGSDLTPLNFSENISIDLPQGI